MQEKIQQKAEDTLAKNHHRRRIWRKVVGVLACIVVFCTTYALILPALTLENHTTYCGLAEHQHRLECYEKTLTCGQEEADDSVHNHTDDCYASEEVLECGLEEGEGIPGHTHTDACYERVLACSKEEHAHELNCYSDPEVDLESPEDWLHSVSGVELTHNRNCDLVAVAESQLGYTESSRNYSVDEDGITKKGYTRYGAWYGDPYGDWCAMFVSFCLDHAGIPAEAFPQENSCSRWVETLKNEEYGFYREKENYTPKTGDLIFFDHDGDGSADRVGIVAQMTEDTPEIAGKLKIIEGDAENCVQYTEYSQDDANILGYGELPEEPRVEYRWSQDGLEVVASVRESAEVPENAGLVVKPLSPEDEESAYAERYAASQEKIAIEDSAEITQFELFRVYLEADGQQVLPQEEATVEIRLLEDNPSVEPNVKMFHYSEDGAEKVAPERDEASGSLTGSFDAALSGAYAIVGAKEISDVPQILAETSDTPTAAEPMPIADTPTATDAATDNDLIPHKRIDAFRDGTDNPDTTLDNQEIDQTDLYRLYLDAEISKLNKPIDLLIVVDQSGSMHNADGQDLTKEGGLPAYRDEALRLVLNGTSSTNSNDYETNKQNGLIYQFLDANPENKVCVVGFQGHGYDPSRYGADYRYGPGNTFKTTADGELADEGKGKYQIDGYYPNNGTDMNFTSGIVDSLGYLEAETLLTWTSNKDAAFVNVQGLIYNATNYTAGFIQAQRELDRAKDDGRQKVVLFLSDGKPTCHIEKATVNVGSWWRPQYEEQVFRDGDGSNENVDKNNNGIDTDKATTTAFNNLIQANQGITFHTVSIKAGDAEGRLATMAKDGHGTCYSITSTEELENNLKEMIFGESYTNLKIEDNLSQYVDLYDSQPDFKVMLKKSDGSEVPLWENDTMTENGEGIITTVNYDSEHKTVTALFESTYKVEPGSTVTLSFNVQTNRKAYQEYIKKGYPNTGQEDTDYTGNSTSSGQGGFHSNASATVSYTTNGEPDGHKNYPYPVVQAAACKIVIQKTDSFDSSQTLPGAEFTLYRKASPGEMGETLENQSESYVKVAEHLTTDANGQIIVGNLIPDDYCLVETKAPDGYRKLKAPVSFTLSRKTDGTGQIVGSEQTITVAEETLPALQVPNIPWGPELPQTGGIGLIPYIVGGLLLMTAAAILLLYKYEKRRKEDFASS